MRQRLKARLQMRRLTTDDTAQYNALLRYAFQVTDSELLSLGWNQKEMERSKKSIRYDTDFTLLSQLFYISEYLRDPALTVTVVDLEADDYREVSGSSTQRKRRAKKVDIVPTRLLDIRDLVFPDDVVKLIPESLPSPFTRDELSREIHLRGRDLWAALKLLEALRMIERTEPLGRKHRYIKLI